MLYTQGNGEKIFIIDDSIMIDNFDKFKWDFGPWMFYFIQVIIRWKDWWVPEIWNRNNARCIKTYYIYNQNDLDSKKPYIINIAETNWARVYIHPAKRDAKKIAIELIQYVLWRITDGSEEYLNKCYEIVCWKHIPKNKLWVVDVDSKEQNEIDRVGQIIESARWPENKIQQLIETVNWFHFITKPFDSKDIDVDVQKNNPTLLYYKQNEEGRGNETSWEV